MFDVGRVSMGREHEVGPSKGQGVESGYVAQYVGARSVRSTFSMGLNKGVPARRTVSLVNPAAT